ncbi:MAG: hypothetical protein WD005_03945, partial [Haliea sp.]
AQSGIEPAAVYAFTSATTLVKCCELKSVPLVLGGYINRCEDAGLEGLLDKRMAQFSSHKAPVDEVLRLEALYRERYEGWNLKQFHERYQRANEGTRSQERPAGQGRGQKGQAQGDVR